MKRESKQYVILKNKGRFSWEITCNFLIAEPSVLKYKSLAIARTLDLFRKTTFFLLPPNAFGDNDAKEDNVSEDFKDFFSIVWLAETTAPTEDMAENVEAILHN